MSSRSAPSPACGQKVSTPPPGWCGQKVTSGSKGSTLHVWSESVHSALGAAWAENDQGVKELMTTDQLTSEGLLVRLLHALNDRDSAYLLWYLLAQQADTGPLKTSRRAIHSDLGGVVGLTNIRIATNRLVEAGLIEVRVHPKTFTEYRVVSEALTELIQAPLLDANFLPGVRPTELAFLKKWNAEHQAP